MPINDNHIIEVGTNVDRNQGLRTHQAHNDLIANCIMLQNVIDITNVCYALIQEGYTIAEENLSLMSPYMAEQLKRFGDTMPYLIPAY